MLVFSLILVVAAGLLAVPVSVFVLEVIAGLTLPAREIAFHSRKESRQRVAVLVPAHNESAVVRSTIDIIKKQLLVGDRVLVVADNCTDDTAAIAAIAGADVIIRNDPKRAGKGYALDFGIKHLALDPPAIVIVVDADCSVTEGTIDRLAAACTTTQRPIQALDLMIAPDGSPIKHYIAEFAWRVKNWVRPLGLSALNLPCQLMGTGMAFPWELIRTVNLADGSIVEDMKLGLELAEAGSRPLFCPTAKVVSCFPLSDAGAKSQRNRWEEGHIIMILTAVPRLFCNSVLHGNVGLLALTLDILVPPLSFLLILITAMTSVAALLVIFGGSWTPLIISVSCLLALAVAVMLSWIKYGRDILPYNRILLVPSYVLKKIPIYFWALSRRTAPIWIRTDRTAVKSSADPKARPPDES